MLGMDACGMHCKLERPLRVSHSATRPAPLRGCGSCRLCRLCSGGARGAATDTVSLRKTWSVGARRAPRARETCTMAGAVPRRFPDRPSTERCRSCRRNCRRSFARSGIPIATTRSRRPRARLVARRARGGEGWWHWCERRRAARSRRRVRARTEQDGVENNPPFRPPRSIFAPDHPRIVVRTIKSIPLTTQWQLKLGVVTVACPWSCPCPGTHWALRLVTSTPAAGLWSTVLQSFVFGEARTRTRRRLRGREAKAPPHDVTVTRRRRVGSRWRSGGGRPDSCGPVKAEAASEGRMAREGARVLVAAMAMVAAAMVAVAPAHATVTVAHITLHACVARALRL